MPQGRPGEAHADDRPVVHERTARRAELVLDGFGPWDDATVLDVGCESGGFVSLASVCGARIAYIDAAPELVEIAVYRMPDGALVVCDVAELPYVDAGFATLTAMTGLPYAVDPVHALAEAARVACPGGRVLAVVWGPAAECDAAEYLVAVQARLPPAPDVAEPFRWSDPAVLENLFAQAGMAVDNRRSVECSWFYSDETTVLDVLLSTRLAASAIEHSGAEVVGEAVRKSIAPFRCRSGKYVLCNKFHAVAGHVPAGDPSFRSRLAALAGPDGVAVVVRLELDRVPGVDVTEHFRPRRAYLAGGVPAFHS